MWETFPCEDVSMCYIAGICSDMSRWCILPQANCKSEVESFQWNIDFNLADKASLIFLSISLRYTINVTIYTVHPINCIESLVHSLVPLWLYHFHGGWCIYPYSSVFIKLHWAMGLLPDTYNCGCACAGNAGNVFPATAGKRSRHASRHVCDARAVMHAGIAN